jgi:hypothetical protein
MPEPVTPMSEEAATKEAHRLIAEAYQPTRYRDDSLPTTSTIGTAPPIPQPGRPPMSSKAIDDSVRMLSASVVIATGGGATTAILWASGYANPAVIGIVFGAPTALVLALSRLAKRAKGVLPEEHHHHYDGATVYQDQRNVHSQTRGVWAKTTNQQ